MNILMINHASSTGGAQRSLTTIVQELLDRGYEVTILTPQGYMCAIWEKLGADIVLWNPPSCFWFGGAVYSSGIVSFHWKSPLALVLLPLGMLRGMKLIKRLLSDKSIKVVHVNSLTLFPLGFILWLLCKRKSIRVLWHIREMLNKHLFLPFRFLIQRSIVLGSSRIIAISSNEAEPFNNSNKVTIVHNTISEDWIVNNDQLVQYKSKSLRRVSMAAQFAHGKGIPDFLHMAKVVSEHFEDVEFILYTSFPSSSSLFGSIIPKDINGITEYIISDRIRIVFGKHLTLKDFAKCFVYVRTDETGCPYGRDIIEAMYVGVPVVATGTCQEFVLDNITGFLVPPNNTAQLCEALEKLLCNESLRDTMAKASRDRAEQLFSPKRYCQNMIPLFNTK